MSDVGANRDLVAEGGFETVCTHYGEHRVAQGGAASPPIYQTSTFLYPDAEAFERRLLPQNPYYDYTRVGNPTTSVLESKIARLEHGAWARAFGSGMGAISAGIDACVKAGAHVVACVNCYPPTFQFLSNYLPKFGVMTTFVKGANPQDFIAAMRPETTLVYLESPTFGTNEIIEIPPIAAAARERGIRTMFDNSWATPYFQNPIDQGIDLVAHSASKYIGGHSDVVAGMLIGRDEESRKSIRLEAELHGAAIDPFAAWLLVRGLRTMGVRMERHQSSGLAIARMLVEHPRVERVLHPGLETHANYAVARQQLRGYSALFSFALKDQTREATNRFLNRLQLFGIGVSWGGFESLATGGTYFSQGGKAEWLIRVSIGLENIDDLCADIRRALED